MLINITPVGGWPKPGVQLCVDDVHVTLGDTANVQWTICDEDGKITSGPGRVSLTPEQYADWTGDDSFVCAAIAANLGLEVVS